MTKTEIQGQMFHPAVERAYIMMLISRLERLSVDSTWAHRASGLRRSLLVLSDRLEQGDDVRELLNARAEQAFDILVKAGREIPDPETFRRQQTKT